VRRIGAFDPEQLPIDDGQNVVTLEAPWLVEASVAKSGRGLDAAAVEYLYRLYMTDVIPPKPRLKLEGIELALQMAGSSVPAAQALRPEDLTDQALVPELEKEGRCNF